jgi:hypothetical protein
MKELLEQFGITEAELAEIQEGETIDYAKAAALVRSKVADILKHDPDFIEPIKTEAVKKVNEQVIVAEKKAKKAFKAIAGIDLSNSEIEAMTLEDLYKTGIEKLKSATGSDAAKLQEEIIALGQALAAEKESKQAEIDRILNEYKTKEVNALANTAILAAFSNVELIIPADEALDILKAKLAKDGITFDRDDNGNIYPKKADLPLLKADKSGKADIKYLIEHYMTNLIKKSNGSGGANGTQRRASTGDTIWEQLGYTKEQWDKFNPNYQRAKISQMRSA